MKRTKLVSVKQISSEKEFDILRQIGLDQYELEYIMYLKYKDEISNKWKKD